MHQLDNLEKVLAVLPADKQNIVFTNRRSKETQSILDKILQTPEEIKIDRNKEQEAVHTEEKSAPKPAEKPKKNSKKTAAKTSSEQDAEALDLVEKYHVFGRKTPGFLLTKVILADDN